MRKFSSTEQEVIKYIVSQELIEAKSFSTLFMKLMPFFAVEQIEDGVRMYCREKDEEVMEVIQSTTRRLLDILFVVKYLDDNALIGIYHIKGEKFKIFFDKNIIKKEDGFYENSDGEWNTKVDTGIMNFYTDCGDLLFYYINSCYHASETLRELVKNNFKDEETIRFEKSMASTRQAICISLVIGLLSIIIGTTGIWLSWKSLNQPLSFPTEKLEEIKTELQHISTTKKEQTPIIINSIPKKDTVPTVSIPKRHK